MRKLLYRIRLSVALFLVVFLVGSITTMPVFGQGQGDPPGLARALEVQQRHTGALMSLPDVIGTAVTEGPGGRAAVMVLARQGGIAGLPAELEGVPVVVNVTGDIVALHHRPDHPGGPGGGDGGNGGGDTDCPSRTGHFRPACIGISTGHPSITAGTIGARVTKGGNVYALSNNHVYAASNAANTGDVVLQPGTFDGGDVSNPAHHLGNLSEFQAIDFSGACTNTIDAAIAISDLDRLGNSTPSDGYGTPRSTVLQPAINMRVMKYGRTTGQTTGRISGLNATVNINFGSAGVACFVNQIIIQPGSFSAGGDSGSLIVAQQGGNERRPVGLLFAGSQTVTIANPIDAVLNRFGVTVDGPS
jgi:hypothetical protein